MNNIAFIIINWNHSKTTLQCLKSLGEKHPVVIVDNNSSISELDTLKNNLPKNTHLIINDKNYGFAAANNRGIKYAIEHFNPKYIMLLNHDTIVTPGFLSPLTDLMDKDNSIGAVQCKLLRANDTGIVDSAGQISYSDGSVRDIGIGKKDRPEYNIQKEVFGACAAGAIYRTSTLIDTGLFDERLFILFEDVDISWRIRLKGYKIYFQPQSIVYHERGISKPGNRKKETKVLQELYGFRNCLSLTLKYYPLHHIIKFFPIHAYRFLTWVKLILLYRVRIPFLKIILSALRERTNIQKQPFIKDIQRKWIVKVSYIDILNIRKKFPKLVAKPNTFFE